MPTNDLLTTIELAEYLKVPVESVRKWRKNRDGPRAVRVGRHIRYRRADIDAWLESRAEAE